MSENEVDSGAVSRTFSSPLLRSDKYPEFSEVGIVVAEECTALAVGRESDVAVDVTDDRAGCPSQNRSAVEHGVIAVFGSGTTEVDVISIERKSQPKVVSTLCRWDNLGVAVARNISNPEALDAVLVFLYIQDVFSIGRDGGQARTPGGGQLLDREILKRHGMAAVEERINSKGRGRDHDESDDTADAESELVLAGNLDCDRTATGLGGRLLLDGNG